MSLTRAEWKEMWRSLRAIEKYIEDRKIPNYEVFGDKHRQAVMDEIEKIKDQIESVIGQMR